MSSLALYRTLVPAHSDVLDATVSAWLTLAARRHSVTAWGQVYPEAMVLWAAHRIESVPGTGAGNGDAGVVGPVVSQTDGDLSRTYSNASAGSSQWFDADMSSTQYGQAYLDLRGSRSAAAPRFIGPNNGNYRSWSWWTS